MHPCAWLLLASFACVSPVSGAVDASLDPAQGVVPQQRWALQMGYFANQQNALNFQQQLNEAGFEAQVVTGGKPGQQHYRVIAGWADDPEDFDALRNALEDQFGERGFPLQNPYLAAAAPPDEAPDEPFEPSDPRYLLAQAGEIQPMSGESVGSTVRPDYDPNYLRTPQDEIDSMPGFTAAGLQIIPTVGLSIGYDDNITRASSNEIDSTFYIIAPAITVELPTDHSVLALTAAVNIVRYSDSPTDDREPWYVRGAWAWDISTRQDLSLFAQYGEGADRRGTGRRQGDAGLQETPLDEWERLDFGGLWRYGAVGSRGRLDLRAGASNLEYTNNRQVTEQLDREWWFGGGTFYWRVAPKTSLLADLEYSEIDYDIADTDSEVTHWMLGLTWDATARTSGRISYGEQEKDFKNPDIGDYEGPIWMASVSWRPRTYSMFTLTGTRSAMEPDGNADYVLREDISLAWTHDWSARFSTVMDVGYGEDDYRPDGRMDEIWYWGIGARYLFNQHFRFGASVQGYDRDSEEPEFVYKRMLYLLTLEASF